MRGFLCISVIIYCFGTHVVYTPKDRNTDKPRGFTFICYRRVENAEEAIRGMNGRVRESERREGRERNGMTFILRVRICCA